MRVVSSAGCGAAVTIVQTMASKTVQKICIGLFMDVSFNLLSNVRDDRLRGAQLLGVRSTDLLDLYDVGSSYLIMPTLLLLIKSHPKNTKHKRYDRNVISKISPNTLT